MKMIWESAIRAGDFAGFVPASRGCSLPPPAPQASLSVFPREEREEPRRYRRPGLGRSDFDYARPLTDVRRPLPGAARQWYRGRKTHSGTLPFVTIINSWRTFRGGVAVI
jgi:hypothetical protein